MGWFLVTIALPVLAPSIALLCIRAFPLPIRPARLALVNVVKDGQLCWTSIGFCVSSLRELTRTSATGLILSAQRDQYLIGGFIFVLVVASLFAAFGTVFTTPQARRSGVSRIRHFRVFVCSLLMTAASAFGYSVIQFEMFLDKEMQ